MENQNLSQEKETVKEKIKDLQKLLIEDLKRGHYYGVTEKIRKLQQNLSLSLRI